MCFRRISHHPPPPPLFRDRKVRAPENTTGPITTTGFANVDKLTGQGPIGPLKWAVIWMSVLTMIVLAQISCADEPIVRVCARVCGGHIVAFPRRLVSAPSFIGQGASVTTSPLMVAHARTRSRRCKSCVQQNRSESFHWARCKLMLRSISVSDHFFDAGMFEGTTFEIMRFWHKRV